MTLDMSDVEQLTLYLLVVKLILKTQAQDQKYYSTVNQEMSCTNTSRFLLHSESGRIL